MNFVTLRAEMTRYMMKKESEVTNQINDRTRCRVDKSFQYSQLNFIELLFSSDL